MAPQPWHEAPIVALDLEGSGAQDRDAEAILEIAAVPLVDGRPDLAQAFTSLVNPCRKIPRRPWISPGLTNEALATAPALQEIEPKLAELINGRWLLGHNVIVDWRLLHRRLPALHPAGLIDTLALARALGEPKRSLSVLLEQLHLAEVLQESAAGSQPHRAYWDSMATAYLLSRLVSRFWPQTPPTLDMLLRTAGIPLKPDSPEQPALFE